MRQMILRNVAIAISTVACAALLSFGWSEQRGVSLGVESAQAADRSTVDPHSAGVARRQYRRSVYGYGVHPGACYAKPQPPSPRPGTTMTITTPTPAAITSALMADTLAAATSVSATSPDSTDGPRCFRATTAPKAPLRRSDR
jgi:hypothetical protein